MFYKHNGVGYIKLVPFNLAEFLTPLALAV